MRSCPKCKSSEYNNRSFILMINECGHSLCKNCVELIFARGSAECPVCKRTLKKNAFWEQTLDDPQIEKDVYFRKKLQKTYNLKEDDFSDLRAYNDYLEEYESLVFNLANDVDVEETLRKVEDFKREKEEAIARNRTRKTQDELWIQQMIEEDSRFRNRISSFQEEATENVTTKGSADARAIIDELQKSDQPAAFIVINKQREQTEKNKHYPLNRDAGGMMEEGKVFLPVSYSLGEKYTYECPRVDRNGPEVPDVSELEAIGYLSNIRTATPDQMAGGYHESYGCIRALGEARVGLFAC